MHQLPRDFYEHDADVVARALLGTVLARRVGGVLRLGRVVETEAYLGPHDLASHSSRGRTRRNATMFGPPGHAYVYLIYGLHHCLNAVTGPEGHAAAVLIRSLEPLQAIEESTRGPGRLCRALEIDRRQDGLDLLGDELFFAEPETVDPFEIASGPRVGVGYAGDWAERPLRYWVKGSRFLSRR